MIKHLIGPAIPNARPGLDPIPQWREALRTATAETQVKLLVDIAFWSQQHPESAEARTVLGDAYIRVRQPYAAEQAFRSALGIEASSARAREGLGLALSQIGRHAEAGQQFAIAHKIDPANAEILVHWGLALLALGFLKPAHKRFKMALERNENNTLAWLNLGVVDLQRDSPTTALTYIKKAQEIQPALGIAHYYAAMSYRALDQLQEATTAAEQAIETDPGQLDPLLLLADIQLDAGWLEPATTTLSSAIRFFPAAPEVHMRRSRLYKMRGQLSDALGILATAHQLGGSEATIQLAMSEIQLLLQDWASGWDHYEARKQIRPSPVRTFPFPEWDGGDPSSHTVLVHAEQGLSNTMLFAQCLPELIQIARHVVLEVPTELAELMQRSFPTSTVVGRHPRWDTSTTWMDDFRPRITRQIPIGSLPRFFRVCPEDFVSKPPAYLKADPSRVDFWRGRLSNNKHPSVGIAWMGGMPQTGKHYCSIAQSLLAQHLQHLPIQWVSLQHGQAASDQGAAPLASSWRPQAWPQALESFDELAALTCALDYVVAVCGTQAHLCGALGIPALVLAPAAPAWPYGFHDQTTVWHPSLSVLRQKTLHEWGPVLDTVSSALATLFQPGGHP
ncbi:tetratricopeptide repeat protein [Hydrogenophaga defluvii]|uniref:Tetratricopeptide repeat protein n=1 Tax=Hydrogenophaga defluvii TaxID=249410 RepID=A0ABW2SDZ0_9BURK